MRITGILFFGLLVGASSALAQSYAFGLKVGPTLGLQRWNGFQGNDPLIQYHAMAFIETADEDNLGALFAEAGYHVKGRAVHFRASVHPVTGTPYDAQTYQLKFNNASLSLGGKKKFFVGANLAYYSIAVRAEYNLSTDLEIYEGFEGGINKFVYGLTLGGGFEFPFTEFVGGLIDFRFSPDISRQIFLPPFEFQNPYTGTLDVFGQQSVKNLAFEVSLGLRFLHKITYID